MEKTSAEFFLSFSFSIGHCGRIAQLSQIIKTSHMSTVRGNRLTKFQLAISFYFRIFESGATRMGRSRGYCFGVINVRHFGKSDYYGACK